MAAIRPMQMPVDTGGVSDEEVLATFPGYRIDHDNKSFYKGWLLRKLLFNRCGDCGRWHHPPRPICPGCWSANVVPTEISGRGTVHLLIHLHQGPPVPGVDYSRPHPVAVVELEEQEGLRFTSTIVGCGAEAIRFGMPVRLDWIERSGAPFPVFRPA